jgi:hypothetical protein
MHHTTSPGYIKLNSSHHKPWLYQAEYITLLALAKYIPPLAVAIPVKYITLLALISS